MIEKFFDNIAKGLYESLSGFDGLDRLVLTISLLIFSLGITVAVYLYKEVKKANEKTMAIMERHEQVQAQNVREYKELNHAGLQVLAKVNETMQENSASNKEIVHTIEKSNIILDVILKKVI